MPSTAPVTGQLASASARASEVGDPDDAVLVEEKVRGLDVPVDQTAPVRVLEAGRDLAAHVRRLRRGQPDPGVEHPPQRAADKQLQDHEGDAVVLTPVVDGHDVGVVERGGELGLGSEPAQETDVVGRPAWSTLTRRAGAAYVVGVYALPLRPLRSNRAGDSGRRERPTRSATVLRQPSNHATGHRLAGALDAQKCRSATRSRR